MIQTQADGPESRWTLKVNDFKNSVFMNLQLKNFGWPDTEVLAVAKHSVTLEASMHELTPVYSTAHHTLL